MTVRSNGRSIYRGVLKQLKRIEERYGVEPEYGGKRELPIRSDQAILSDGGGSMVQQVQVFGEGVGGCAPPRRHSEDRSQRTEAMLE